MAPRDYVLARRIASAARRRAFRPIGSISATSTCSRSPSRFAARPEAPVFVSPLSGVAFGCFRRRGLGCGGEVARKRAVGLTATIVPPFCQACSNRAARSLRRSAGLGSAFQNRAKSPISARARSRSGLV